MDNFEHVLKMIGKLGILLINISGDYGGKLLQLGCKKKMEQLGLRYIEIEPFSYLSKFSYYFLHMSIRVQRVLQMRFAKSFTYQIVSWLQDIIVRKAILKALIDRSEKHLFSLVLVHGSGTLSDITPTKLIAFKAILKIFTKVPIATGPQSYWFPYTDFKLLLSQPAQPIFLFTRERYSYTILRNIFKDVPNVYVMLSPDTAFYISREDFNEVKGSHILIGLRNDKESVVPYEYKRKIIEHALQHRGSKSIIVADVGKADSFSTYLKLITNAEAIVTDRLHVAILGAILEKKVFLIGNIYHKNRGVYEYSLSSYSNVRYYELPTDIESLIKDLDTLWKT
jgi:exopolysaccharide biosynthesis predicted pyruvyltransferase EpsI